MVVCVYDNEEEWSITVTSGIGVWCTTLYRHSRPDHAVPLEGDRGTVFRSSAAISQAAEWQMTTAIQRNT